MKRSSPSSYHSIAERLIRRRLELKPDLAHDMIKSALQLAAGSPQIKIKLHPDDAALLGSHATEVVRALAFFLGMERLLSDQALKQGRLGDALAHTGDEGRSTLR